MADYSKLPPTPPIDMCFLLDPLLATGGTACAALTMIIDWGVPGKTVVLNTNEALFIVWQYQRSSCSLYSDPRKDSSMCRPNSLT